MGDTDRCGSIDDKGDAAAWFAEFGGLSSGLHDRLRAIVRHQDQHNFSILVELDAEESLVRAAGASCGQNGAALGATLPARPKNACCSPLGYDDDDQLVV